MAWRRNGPCGWASGHCQRPGPGRRRGGLHRRADSGPAEEPLPRSRAAAGPPGTRCPAAPGRAWMSAGTPRRRRYRRREAAILVTSGSSIPRRQSTATVRPPGRGHARRGRGPASSRSGCKHAYADGGFLVLTVRPSRMRALRGRTSAAVRARAGLVRRPALRRPARGGQGTGDRLVHHRAGRRRGSVQPGLEEPAAPGRAGGPEDRRRPVRAARSICCWSIRA